MGLEGNENADVNVTVITTWMSERIKELETLSEKNEMVLCHGHSYNSGCMRLHEIDCREAVPEYLCDHLCVTFTRRYTAGILTTQTLGWYSEKTAGTGKRLSTFVKSLRVKLAGWSAFG